MPVNSIIIAMKITVIKLVVGISNIVSRIILDLGSLSFPTNLSHKLPNAEGKY